MRWSRGWGACARQDNHRRSAARSDRARRPRQRLPKRGALHGAGGPVRDGWLATGRGGAARGDGRPGSCAKTWITGAPDHARPGALRRLVRPRFPRSPPLGLRSNRPALPRLWDTDPLNEIDRRPLAPALLVRVVPGKCRVSRASSAASGVASTPRLIHSDSNGRATKCAGLSKLHQVAMEMLTESQTGPSALI